MLAVARRLAKHWPAVELTLLDRIDLVSHATRDGFGKLGWRVETVTADVFEWMQSAGAPRFDAVTANLFLHHFDNAGLADFFRTCSGWRRYCWPPSRTVAVFRWPPPACCGRSAPTTSRCMMRPPACALALPVRSFRRFGRPGRGKPLEERRGGLFSHVFAAAGQ